MVPCTPPEHPRRAAFAAAGILRAIAAFMACMAFAAPAVSAEFDPATPAPRLLPADSDDSLTPVWRGRPTVPPSTQTRQAAPAQHRHQQPRRSNTVSGARQAAYQPGSSRNQPATTTPQTEATFSGVAVWGDDEPVASAEPIVEVEGESPCQDCGGCGRQDRCRTCDDECEFAEWLTPLAGRLWVRGEYLAWWTQGGSLPALVTTSPAGTARGTAGRLDQSSTTILLGGDTGLTSDARSGARVEIGYWLLPCQGLGFEVSYLELGSQTSQFAADSGSYSILARPFYNLQDGSQGPDAALVVFPHVADGSITVTATNKFQTAEGLLRRHVMKQCGRSIDFLVGYRYGYLQDTLLIDETMTSLDRQSPAPVGTVFKTLDQFDTQNRFNGGEVGIVFQQRYCRWSLDLLMKLALGSTHSQVAINGSTAITPRGAATTTYPGGILALPTNIGAYEQNSLSLIPELGVTLGYDVTRRLRATFGYTFLYWSNVARPGDQIDTDVNASQFPPGTLAGAARPKFTLHTSDFWAQGLNVGLEYRF